MSIVWPWMKEKPRPYCAPRPDGWSNQARFYVPRPLAPVNDVSDTPIAKTVETIPAGERREIFNLSGTGPLLLFRNQTNLPVEINEIFMIASVAGTIQLRIGMQAQTPIISLAVTQSYSDSGFSLPLNADVFCDLESSTPPMVISGFLRWRYI